jgi:hypothetical protein
VHKFAMRGEHLTGVSILQKIIIKKIKNMNHKVIQYIKPILPHNIIKYPQSKKAKLIHA